MCGVTGGPFGGLDPAPPALSQLSGGSDVMYNGGPQDEGMRVRNQIPAYSRVKIKV